MLAPVNARDWKSDSGIIGLATLASTPTKAHNKSTPAAIAPKIQGLPRPQLADSSKPNTTLPNPRTAKKAPQRSKCLAAPSFRLSGTRLRLIAIIAIAKGRFIQNVQRQDKFSISHPPNTGPTAEVMAVKPDHRPIARPRSATGNDALMIAKLPGIKSAPPIP